VSFADSDYSSEWTSKTLENGDGKLWVDGPHHLYRFFRYKIYCRYREGQHKANSQLELQVQTPGATDFVMMTDENGGRACYEGGCEDMALSRTEWNCQPPPTPSNPFVPSAPLRPSALRESPTLPDSELCASDDPAQSAPLLESSAIATSPEFNSSQPFNSVGLPLSEDFKGSDGLNESVFAQPSGLLTPSDEGIPSDAPAPSNLPPSGLLPPTMPLGRSPDFAASLGQSRSSQYVGTPGLDHSRAFGLSGAFLKTDLLPVPLLQRGSPSFAVAGSFLGAFTGIIVIVFIAVFIWRRKARSATPDETEMVVDGQSTEQTEHMSTLEDEFMGGVATQYQTIDADDAAFLGFTRVDAFQETIFAF
jgi:hypothetical protein